MQQRRALQSDYDALKRTTEALADQADFGDATPRALKRASMLREETLSSQSLAKLIDEQMAEDAEEEAKEASQLEEARAEHTEASQRIALAQEAEHALQAMQEALQRQKQGEEELAAAKKRLAAQEALDPKREEIARSIAAKEAALPAYTRLEQKRQDAAQLAREIGATEEEAKRIDAERERLKKVLDEAEKTTANLGDAQANVAHAQAAHTIAQKEAREAEQLVQALSSYKQACQKALELEKRANAAKAEEASRTSTWEQAQAVEKAAAETAQALSDAPAKEEEAKRLLEQAKSKLDSIEEARRSLRNLAARLSSAVKERAAAQAAYARCAENLDQANRDHLAAQRQRLDGQAGLLAQTLQDDQPCPVCGSTQHPAPAPLPDAIPSKEDVERLADIAQKAAGKAQNASNQAAAACALVEKTEADLNDAEERLGTDAALAARRGRMPRNVERTRNRACCPHACGARSTPQRNVLFHRHMMPSNKQLRKCKRQPRRQPPRTWHGKARLPSKRR